MAFKPFEAFAKMDAKTRLFFVSAGIAVVIVAIYFAVRIFGGGETATGPSRVAGAPQGLQSVPGSQLTPEYYRALVQANAQAAQQAQISGGSAVPTLINVPGQAFPQSTTNCTIICPGDESCDVPSQIADMVRSGAFSQDDANKFLDLVKSNVLPDEFMAALNDGMKQNKLSPDTARKLLDCYRKQYASALIAASGRVMDGLIKSGQLPLDVANQLLELQRKKASVADYAAALQRLVAAGKISPEVAAQLLAQYQKQQQAELAKTGALQLQQMAKAGQITPDVANQLLGLQKQNVPVDQYAATLQRLVAEGKLTPEAAAKLLAQYQKQHIGGSAAIDGLVSAHEKQAADDLAALVKSGAISQDVADGLLALQKKNVTPEEYQAYLARLVKEGKLTPEQAQQLLAQYKKLYAVRQEAARLKALQGNNASLDDYANELKQAVQAGILTPDEAAKLYQDYQNVLTPPTAPGLAGVDTSIPGSADFAKLQQRLSQQQLPAAVPVDTSQQFQTVAADTSAADQQARLDRIRAMQAAMSQQAQDLLSKAWATPMMVYRAGTPESVKKASTTTDVTDTTTTTTVPGSVPGSQPPLGPPIIKAGTILFAVLDTTLDSDYPDTPAMATIVSGQFKGAKLLGRMNVVKDKDRMAITFTLMNMDNWLTGKNINAFAIDPDTARTAMASSVDNHYFLRYGGLFAASFLSGYANAIMNSGSTNVTGIFGTSTTRSAFSPGEKIATGLGQFGTAITNNMQQKLNIQPTIKVNAGVGLGILFMADVTQ